MSRPLLTGAAGALKDGVAVKMRSHRVFVSAMCVGAFAVVLAGVNLRASAASSPNGPAPCQATHTIGARDSLGALADFYFGDSRYGPAILLATNARSGHDHFKFIGDANRLLPGAEVCVPTFAEAERLRLRYETYRRAVAAMVQAEPWEISDSLVAIDSAKPVRVVTWIREDQIAGLKKKAAAGENQTEEAWITQAPSDMWVTVVPKLKSFCQVYFKDHNGSVEQLTLRLEQRLGLPPGAGKTTFVEIVVKDPSTATSLFRPCVVPLVSTTSCPLGPPPDNVPISYRNWVFAQYYWSYAVAQPYSYPWTSLGYTFDWARPEKGNEPFVRFGESEFVIPKGGALEIQSVAGTAKYCSE